MRSKYEVVMSPFNPANRTRDFFDTKKEACDHARNLTSDERGSIGVEVKRDGQVIAWHEGGVSPRLNWVH